MRTVSQGHFWRNSRFDFLFVWRYRVIVRLLGWRTIYPYSFRDMAHDWTPSVPHPWRKNVSTRWHVLSTYHLISGHATRLNSYLYLHGQYFKGINCRIGRGISMKISLWLCGPMSSERVSWRLSAIFRIIFVPWRYEKPHAISSTKIYYEKKHDEKQKA